jgi:acylphosphatase
MDMKQKIKIVGPKVHDVGFRLFLLEEALNIDIEKFNAYNKFEGGTQAVVVLLEGDENQLAEFREYSEDNRPPTADVSSVKFEDYEGKVMSIDRYLHVIQIGQLQKGISALQGIDGTLQGVDGELQGIDGTLQGVDGKLQGIDEKLQSIDGKQDQTHDKLDQILEKQDDTIGEIRELREDLARRDTGERLARIEKDIRVIKSKMSIR